VLCWTAVSQLDVCIYIWDLKSGSHSTYFPIHPSVFCARLIQLRAAMGLEPIPAVIGREAGYTLDRSSVHHNNHLSHRGESGLGFVLFCWVFFVLSFPVLLWKNNSPLVSDHLPFLMCPVWLSSLIPNCVHLFPSPSMCTYSLRLPLSCAGEFISALVFVRSL